MEAVVAKELPSLNALGLKFRTDKASTEHDYLSFYESFLGKLRNDPIKILEVGALFGSSLRMWEEYFPKGIIIAGDIHPGVESHRTSRIFTENIDQSNIEDLVQLGMKHGPFDLIIEDGSHLWEHQITTLRTLFPFLKNDGIYIVEDLHTNFGGLADQFCGVSSISLVEYLKKLLDIRVADDQIDISRLEDPFLRTYGRNIQYLTFYRRACVLKKNYTAHPYRVVGPGPELNDISDAALAGNEEANTSGNFSLVCHIGEIGDRESTTGAIKALRDDVDIEGFIVYCEGQLESGFEYRARLADGAWAAWVGNGRFAGTMGKGESLTGFAVRLSGPSKKKYSLQLIGLFRGQSDAVIARDGAECVPVATRSKLYGMQIAFRPMS
jgi:hypothetical protein